MNENEDIQESERASHVGRLLLHAHRDFSARASRHLAELGYANVTVAHIALLPHLERAGTRVTVLAQRAGMTKQGMGQLIQELERLGYVRREPDPADHRAALVKFTATGTRLLDDAIGVTRAIEHEYAARLGAEQLASLKRALAALTNDSP